MDQISPILNVYIYCSFLKWGSLHLFLINFILLLWASFSNFLICTLYFFLPKVLAIKFGANLIIIISTKMPVLDFSSRTSTSLYFPVCSKIGTCYKYSRFQLQTPVLLFYSRKILFHILLSSSQNSQICRVQLKKKIIRNSTV